MIHLVFDPKWYPAIPVFQVLSVSTAVNSLCGPIVSLFQGQGRFVFLFRYQLFTAALFLTLVIIGALMGQALGVAVCLLILNFAITPLTITLAIRPAGMGLRDALKFMLAPAAIAAAAVAPAAGVVALFQALGIHSNLLVIVTALATSGPTCLAFIRFWQPWVWQEVADRIRRVANARSGRTVPA